MTAPTTAAAARVQVLRHYRATRTYAAPVRAARETREVLARVFADAIIAHEDAGHVEHTEAVYRAAVALHETVRDRAAMDSPEHLTALTRSQQFWKTGNRVVRDERRGCVTA